MSKLRIKDAPLLPNVDGSEKIPTGGKGDFSVTLDQVKTFARGGLPQQLEDHLNDTSNPHQVTKDQVGLGNVDNTSDVDKPVSTATQAVLDLKADKTAVHSKSLTLPTYYTKEVGVNPVIGVAGGAYFNVRSNDDETMLVEYQNVGGVAVATGKSYLSALGVQQQEKSASTIKDASGQNQQQINDATTRRVGCIHDLISPSNRKNGETVRVESYWLGLNKGGNTFVWRSGVEKSRHNGVTIIDPTKAWGGSRETWAYQSGVAARTEVLFPVGAAYTSTIDGTVYPYRALNNPTNIRDRMPVIGGWASPIGNNSGTGCWVAEDTLRVSVCQAGAVGDASYDEDADTVVDGTDDSIAFFVATNALQKYNSTFVFEPFTYTHGSGDERIIFLLLEGFKRLKIEAHGARIQSHSTNPSLVANSFMWIRSKHVDIYGMEYDGLLNMRTPYGGDANQINKQHGFFVLEGSRYVNFWGVTSNRTLMDGFTIGSIASADFATPYEINFHACTALKNYRQGMSLIRGKGVHVYGGDYSETGTLKGTSPMAGIDFECEAVAIGEMVTVSFVIGARLQNNNGSGFIFALGSKNCFIDTCTITGNGGNGVLVSPPTMGNEVRNCIIENNTQLMTSYGDAAEIYAYGYRTKFLRNTIKPRRRAIVSTAVGNTKHMVFDGNIIDATDSAAGAGDVAIVGDVCSQYANNIHINTETELPNAHAVTIDAKSAVVTNNEHYQDRAQRISGGFLGVRKAKLVTDNKAEGSYVSSKPVIEFRRNATDFVDHFGRNIINGVMGDSGSIKNGIYTPPVINRGNKVGFGTAAPTTGTWKAGDIVYKSNPSLTNAVNNMAYFECITSGTFEDLTGITGSVTTGTRIVTLSSVSGLYAGMFISVAGAVANNEIVAIDTVASTVTISADATATVSGAAVTTTDPVFVAKGRVAMRGTTANRPTLTSSDVGFKYYDTTLATTGKPIEWTGLAWVDSTGSIV